MSKINIKLTMINIAFIFSIYISLTFINTNFNNYNLPLKIFSIFIFHYIFSTMKNRYNK